MNTKSILIGLVAIILIGGWYFIFYTPSLPPVISSAIPILKINVIPATTEEVKGVFFQNYEKIINNTKSFCFEKNTTIFFPNYLKVEKRVWQGDMFWIGKTKEEKFIINLPFVSKEKKWKYENGKVLVSYLTCKDPTEVMVMEERTGKAYCSSGIIEVWKESKYLKFLLENDTIYFAGGC